MRKACCTNANGKRRLPGLRTVGDTEISGDRVRNLLISSYASQEYVIEFVKYLNDHDSVLKRNNGTRYLFGKRSKRDTTSIRYNFDFRRHSGDRQASGTGTERSIVHQASQ